MNLNMNNKNIEELENKIKDFEEQQLKKSNKKTLKEYQKLNIVYNIFADLLGSVLTAFVLNKIYNHFFEKNNLIFALLLIFCSIAGLYNTIKYFFKNSK